MINYNPREVELSQVGKSYINVDGYLMVRKPKGYPHKNRHILYHRLVLEKKIGRVLIGTEQGHHKNGNRLDNHPDNLVLCADNTEHSRQEQITREWMKQRGIKFKYTLSEAAMEARRRGARAKKPKKIEWCDPDWIKREYIEKERSFRDIGAELKWHKNKVKRFLNELGVELRSHKQQATLAILKRSN